MKTTLKLTALFVLAAIALTACEPKNEPVVNTTTQEITINAHIQGQTKLNAPSKRRVATNGMQSAFEQGDQIQVYGWTGDKTTVPANPPINALNTLTIENDVETWTATPQMHWQSQTAAHYFIGIYPVPAKPISDFKADPYTLNLDDQEASDLLVAVSDDQGIVANNRGVDLNFKHMMAKIHVNLHLRTQVVDWSLEGVRYFGDKEATINYLTQQVNCGSYQYEPMKYFNLPALATPQSGYHASYETLVIPQAGVRRLDVMIAGYTYSYNGTEDIPLESGKITTINLHVAKDNITLEGITVGDWHDGTTAEGGVAEEVILPYVDLGLPTGTLWATCNVGANAPEEVGDYFAWGETAPKTSYNWTGEGDYKWGVYDYEETTNYGMTKYNSTDGWTTLEATDDAATAILGSGWRTPKADEFDELLTECTWTATSRNNVSGYEVKGRNGNSIFIPMSGYRREGTLQATTTGGNYWSSSLSYRAVKDASILFMEPTDGPRVTDNVRFFGLPVRPVYVP